MGHIDTVGVDDYKPDPSIAFDPDRIPEYLLNMEGLDPQVKKDIESGEFMFGRGSLDMKSGVASQMYVVKYYSEHTDELDGNLLAIAHCDEEDMSHGILTGLLDLKRLKEEEGFEYIASINSDYCTPYYEGDEIDTSISAQWANCFHHFMLSGGNPCRQSLRRIGPQYDCSRNYSKNGIKY